MRATLRQLHGADWAVLKILRLEALTEHPDLFSPTSDAFAFTDAQWRQRLTDLHGATFGLFCGNEPVGMTTVLREGNQPTSTRAFLVGSYIQEAHRGKGYSRLFYEARIAWARGQGDVVCLEVEARDYNTASHRAHQRFGFVFVGEDEEVRPNGVFRNLIYQLEL